MMNKEQLSLRDTPWVTALLREILMDESHIPVWEYADGYHPCEESMNHAIHELPLREQHLIYALYRDDMPLQTAYDIDGLSSYEAAALLNHALAELRKPSHLRIVMKGVKGCKSETESISHLPVEDIQVLGIETLSLPLCYWDTYDSVGIHTIGELYSYLTDMAMRCDEGIPVDESISQATQCQMKALGIWDVLLQEPRQDEYRWAGMLIMALRHSEEMPSIHQIREALTLLPSIEREVLNGIYCMRHSERLISLHLRMDESDVADVHARAREHLKESMCRITREELPSVMPRPQFWQPLQGGIL